MRFYSASFLAKRAERENDDEAASFDRRVQRCVPAKTKTPAANDAALAHELSNEAVGWTTESRLENSIPSLVSPVADKLLKLVDRSLDRVESLEFSS